MPPEILVVDDDEDICMVVKLILEGEGLRVTEASDGEEALAKLRGGLQPRLILLDMMMPKMDGEAFLRELHRDPQRRHLPVVIMSGNRQSRQRAAELSVQGYLIKPVELDELLRVVRQFAGWGQSGELDAHA